MNKWKRFRFLPVAPLGEDGKMVTGSKEHIQISREAAREGMVLLKNEDEILPLKQGTKVALFGRGCVFYVKGGGGSGDVTVAYVKDFCQAMQEKEEDGKVEVFMPLCEFYREAKANHKPGIEPEIPQELLDDAAKECDVAIISICRFSAEGFDRTGAKNDGDGQNGDAGGGKCPQGSGA